MNGMQIEKKRKRKESNACVDYNKPLSSPPSRSFSFLRLAPLFSDATHRPIGPLTHRPFTPPSVPPHTFAFLYNTLKNTTMSPRTHIAILGGGISGLSTAWYLSKAAPATVSITLIEAANRTGGWLHSDRVQDPRHDDGSILLERGPRSLRPQGISGLNTLELVM